MKQGSDLIELRLTWREMENYIFGGIFRFFGYIYEDFREIFEKLVLSEKNTNFHQPETN